MDGTNVSVFIAVAISGLLTVVWMGVLAWTGVRYVRIEGGEPVSRPALVIWLASIAGAFTGPCALLFGLVGLIGGLWMAYRKPPANERTRAAAVGAAAGGGVLVLMIVLMCLVMAIGGVFSAR